MSARQVQGPAKIRVKGTIVPPRGTPGANGAYLVDLDVEVPVQGLIDWIDAFLKDRGERHLDNLIKQRDEGTPYFTQFIDDSVIDFVQQTPEIGQGVREGNTIIEIKIPHQSIEYLAATDKAAKQYHVCHCPLVKESIAHDEMAISSAFCDFCPSFNAKPWEVIFGQKLQYEILESALRGDIWCKFAIYLPLT